MAETVADVRLRELLRRLEEISVTTTPENFCEDAVCKLLGDIDCEVGHIVVVMQLERMLKRAHETARESCHDPAPVATAMCSASFDIADLLARALQPPFRPDAVSEYLLALSQRLRNILSNTVQDSPFEPLRKYLHEVLRELNTTTLLTLIKYH